VKEMRFRFVVVFCLSFALSGCGSNQEVVIQPKEVTETVSGFEKLLREECPNLDELRAQGLNCYGEPFGSSNDSEECLPGETPAYNEGDEMICVSEEELDQYGEDRLNELLDQY
jgi:hypothetical protein